MSNRALHELELRLKSVDDYVDRTTGFDGYCTDCEAKVKVRRGRCGCGSGRVVLKGTEAYTSLNIPA